MELARRDDLEPYVTRDGSTVREWAGMLRVGGEERRVEVGGCVTIPSGTAHRLFNDGDVDLVVVCACAPPYTHDDTVLLEGE